MHLKVSLKCLNLMKKITAKANRKEAIVEESTEEKLQGVIIGKKLNSKVIFRAYVRELVRSCTH